MDWRRKLKSPAETFAELIVNLIQIKKAADTGTPLFSNQGQALDGYSELAMYRSVIEKMGKLATTIESLKIEVVTAPPQSEPHQTLPE